MLLDFALPDHERKLIPEGRVSGSMPWVIAIMTFLTLLAAAAGLIMANAAAQGGANLARQVTVQIIEPDPAARRAQRSAVARLLQTAPGVENVEIIPDAEVRELLAPWLGDDVIDADIPVPSLIDIRLDQPANEESLAQLSKQIAPIAPSTRLDSQADWMVPFFSLMNSLMLLTSGILLLLLIATSASVVLAVRSALNTHRETIEIMHMMGGTDLQAARLFQRRMALDALLGGVVGFILAVLVIWLLSMQFSAAGSSLLTGAALPWYGWIILALIPLAVTGLAMLIARRTVLSALKKIL
ncbi:MAG: FtsX-like permease family protein [Sphingorhabdus sp.]